MSAKSKIQNVYLKKLCKRITNVIYIQPVWCLFYEDKYLFMSVIDELAWHDSHIILLPWEVGI